MSRNIEGETVIIEKIVGVTGDNAGEARREFIAHVPARNGIYTTPAGELEVEICPVTKENSQKVIFSGEAIPKVKNEKKKKQKQKFTVPRRVVVFPPSGEFVRQQIGGNEQLLFQRKREELLRNNGE